MTGHPAKEKAKRSCKALQVAVNAAVELAWDSKLKPDEWGASENPTNTRKGLLSMPPEIVFEVLSHLSPVTNATMVVPLRDLWGPTLEKAYLERPDTLRALSQTCVAYRRRILPLVWGQLDACVSTREEVDVDRSEWKWFQHVGLALFRKCTWLIHHPEHGIFVRDIHVSISRFQVDIILSAFIKCLRSLPNLRSIHILHAYTAIGPPLRRLTDGLSFPSVQTFIGPNYCCGLMKCCGDVRIVECNREDGAKLVSAMRRNCRQVEVVRGINLEGEVPLVKQLTRFAPNIRSLQVGVRLSNNFISHLKEFKNITAMEIQVPQDYSVYPLPTEEEVKDTENSIREVLCCSEATGDRRLQISYRTRRGVKLYKPIPELDSDDSEYDSDALSEHAVWDMRDMLFELDTPLKHVEYVSQGKDVHVY
ncbi:hypothetical protein D9611_008045 [Ephemerocybe angulata]|uniref:F-box domain-containing protein n=1 Tax=Ephemerocybe angulata TaxID=980116 RepID=A0A8H5BZV9_9AGAR|nr:hypothetical protein D9611_008045 [Tulosesus angulatus]